MKGDGSVKRSFSIWPGLAVFLICLFPCSFHYFNNAGEAYLQDMLPALGIFLITAVVLFLIAWPLVRSAGKAAFFSGIAMLAVTNGGLLIALALRLIHRHNPIYFLVLIPVVLVILLVILRKKNPPVKELSMVICIACGALILMQAILAAPVLIDKVTFQREKSTIDVDAVEFQGEKPNVYFLMVDEYSGTENFKRYFDFDNAEFYSFLRDRGFTISDFTSNTESIWTSTIVPNLMNLEYVVEDDATEHEKRMYLGKSVLIDLFRHNGYQVNLISHQNFITGDGCRSIAPLQFPEKITKFIVNNSVIRFMPRVQHVLEKLMPGENRREYARELREIMDLTVRCTDFIEAEKGPTLTISYIQCPHYPFLFDAEGNFRDGGFNFKDQYIFLDQVQFVSSMLQDTIENILAEDPNSLIVVQSDHGARYPGQMLMTYGEPDYDPYVETVYMQNALNCVYYPDTAWDIEGKSSINTWRTILNQLFGTDFDMLEQPTGYICYGTSWKDNRELNLID